MEFSGIILEVDGTLANPVIRIAVAVWSIVLMLVSARFAYLRSRGRKRFPVLATLLYLATPVAQRLIGLALYRMDDPDIISVGFWGFPPLWVAPAMGIAAAVVTFVARRPLSAGPAEPASTRAR